MTNLGLSLPYLKKSEAFTLPKKEAELENNST